MTLTISFCYFCKHFQGDERCFAHPEGIPPLIMEGSEPHLKSEGEDYHYEPKSELDFSYEQYEALFTDKPMPERGVRDSGTYILDEDATEAKETPALTEKAQQELTHEEYCDLIRPPNLFMRGRMEDLIKALSQTFQMSKFVKVAPQEVDQAYEDIITTMTDPDGWTLREISRKLQRSFPGMTDYEAERIARTETTKISNKARELQFEEQNPDDALYFWTGVDDHRTTEICKEIKERSRDGMTLDALKELVIEVQTAHKMKYVGDWCPHPNCRHHAREKVPSLDMYD